MSEEIKDLNKEILESIFDKVLEISKISYEQEINRSKQLLSKSDYLIKYISTITIFVNVFLSLAFTNKVVNLKLLVAMYVVLSIPLILSLFFAVKAQMLKIDKFFPTGKMVLQEIKQNKKLDSALKIQNRIIMNYSSSTEELQLSNNYRAKMLKLAYKQYVFSIIMLAIIILIIMISII